VEIVLKKAVLTGALGKTPFFSQLTKVQSDELLACFQEKVFLEEVVILYFAFERTFNFW